jgi:hypothetical protein
MILDRAINGLKRFKERTGTKKYNEVMEQFASGNPKFHRVIQNMVRSVIERGMALGRQVWIDKNQTTLDRLEPILETLKEGTTHHLAGKKGREYIGEERTNEK